MKDPQIDDKTAEFELMEDVRHFPRMLDTRDSGSAVLRMLGAGGLKVTEGRYKKWPLLVRNAAEAEDDYKARVDLLAPRGFFWQGIQHIGTRPYSRPPEIKAEKGGLPKELEIGGAITRDLDGCRGDLRQLGAQWSMDSVGYGSSAILVDFSDEEGRPYLTKYHDSAVFHVEPGPPGSGGFQEIRVQVSETEIWRFVRGDPKSTNKDKNSPRYARRESYVKGDKGYPKIGEPSGDPKSLYPQTEVPIVFMATGQLSKSAFVLPPLWQYALVERDLINMQSNVGAGARMANTHMRFAKGIDAETIDAWRDVSPGLFYATTSKEAHMEWLHLPADGIDAGLRLEDQLSRAIEVGTLSPMLTRQGGNERATGQAINAARARTVAEGWAFDHMSAWGQVYKFIRKWMQPEAEYQNLGTVVTLHHDFVAEGQHVEAASLAARIYLDPKGGMDPAQFWHEMCRYGIISETTDVDQLAAYSRDAAHNVEAQRTNATKAGVLVEAMKNGAFAGQDNRERLYDALVWLNCLPSSFDPKEAALSDFRAGMPMPQTLIAARAAVGGFGVDPDEGL